MEAKKSKVVIISRVMVKPSSPTPHTKRRYNLSLLDHIANPSFTPLLLCYNTPSFTIFSLKQSLSKTLDLFYPFAGQFNGDFMSVECNDNGAYFLHAKTRSTLSHFLQNPDAKAVAEFIPSSDPETLSEATRNNAVTLVQLTVFSCGGITIALQLSHKITDGFSMSCFARTWAAISSGKCDISLPVFAGPLLPPPNSSIKRAVPKAPQTPLRSRMLVFRSAKLAALKKKIQENGCLGFRPSTLEAVSSLLFRCIVAASGPSALQQMINMRTRLPSSLPENIIGHLIWRLTVNGEPKCHAELHEIATLIRKKLPEFYSGCREEMLDEDELVSMVSKAVKDEAELVMSGIGKVLVTYLSSLRPYEVDFGWGEPAWVTAPLFCDKYLPMMHSKSGQDIEVWVTLEEEGMQKFEQNQELLAFASFDAPRNYTTGHCRL